MKFGFVRRKSAELVGWPGESFLKGRWMATLPRRQPLPVCLWTSLSFSITSGAAFLWLGGKPVSHPSFVPKWCMRIC
jgi:hypothetical protein